MELRDRFDLPITSASAAAVDDMWRRSTCCCRRTPAPSSVWRAPLRMTLTLRSHTSRMPVCCSYGRGCLRRGRQRRVPRRCATASRSAKKDTSLQSRPRSGAPRRKLWIWCARMQRYIRLTRCRCPSLSACSVFSGSADGSIITRPNWLCSRNWRRLRARIGGFSTISGGPYRDRRSRDRDPAGRAFAGWKFAERPCGAPARPWVFRIWRCGGWGWLSRSLVAGL